MSNRFTEQQTRIIEGIGESMLVSASAGSGKTTTMIERTARLVEAGASLSETVICTFTRAAAADMKEKLYNVLHERNKKTPDAMFESQLALLATAEISTLDSLCQRILRNYFYALDLDPGFEVADEAERDALKSESIAEAIAQMLDSGDADFLFFYDAMQTNRKDKKLTELIETLYDYAYTQPDPEAWLTANALHGLSDPTAAERFLAAEERRQSDRLTTRLNAHRLRLEQAAYTRDLPVLDELIGRLSCPSATFDDLPAAKGKIGDAALDAAFKQLKKKPVERIAALRELLHSGDSGADSKRYAAVLLQAVRLAADGFSRRKKRRGVLDYNDLEHGALAVLHNPDAAAEIAQKYKYVFVDEYQDINPLQDSIIRMLSTRSTVMLVGDIKQSIYAFRCCDPQIFLDKLSGFAAHGFCPPVRLNHNFRSRLEILEFCNDVFSYAMTEDFGGVAYARDARLLGRAEHTGGSVITTVLRKGDEERVPNGEVYSVLSHADEGDGRADMRLADCVLRDIVTLLSEGELEENGKTRRVRPSDIAVLTRSASPAAAALYESLRAVGIETHFSAETLFESAPETAVLLAFIRYLNNFSDDIALVSLLRSPLAGLTEDELAAIRLNALAPIDPDEPYPVGHYGAAARRYAADGRGEAADKLRGFFALIDAYEPYSAVLSVGELVGRLVSKTGYFVRVFALPSGAVRAQTLSRFLAHLNTAHKGKTVFEYAQTLYVSAPHTKPDALPESLHILTMHASKGLEFPFVFILNTHKPFNLQDTYAPAILDPEWGLCLKTWDTAAHKVRKNRLFAAAALRLTKRQKEEEMRLLYVSLTRAKERLYLYAALPESHALFQDEDKPTEEAGCFFDWLMPAVRKWGFLEPDESMPDAPPRIDADSRTPDPAVTELLETRLGFTYAHASRELKTTVTELMHDAESEEPYIPARREPDDRAGERGTAYHRAMELISFEGGFDAAWNALELPEITLALVDKTKIRTARETLTALIAGRAYYREQPFLLADGDRLIQGVIDLVILDGDSAIIVDYKTSPVKKLKAGAYDLQLRTYARAAEQILKVSVKQLYIYAFETDECIEVTR